MMVAAGAMPPVAEKTSGVKEPISISRTRCSYARLLRPSCCLYVEAIAEGFTCNCIEDLKKPWTWAVRKVPPVVNDITHNP